MNAKLRTRLFYLTMLSLAPLSCTHAADGSREAKRIFAHYVKCGQGNASPYTITMRVQFHEDGNPEWIGLSEGDKPKYRADPQYKQAVDSLFRTMRGCGAVEGLSKRNYQEWRDVELAFEPRVSIPPEGK